MKDRVSGTQASLPQDYNWITVNDALLVCLGCTYCSNFVYGDDDGCSRARKSFIRGDEAIILGGTKLMPSTYVRE